MSKKKSNKIFTRGYKEVKKRVKKAYKFVCSCDNCIYYYINEEDDSEEVCHNPNVLEYDICIDLVNNRTYCNYWLNEEVKDF